MLLLLERYLEHDTRVSNGRQVSETPILSANPKPAKPHADFPLYTHRSGRWAKKIRGRLHYFGPWDDPEPALSGWPGCGGGITSAGMTCSRAFCNIPADGLIGFTQSSATAPTSSTWHVSGSSPVGSMSMLT